MSLPEVMQNKGLAQQQPPPDTAGQPSPMTETSNSYTFAGKIAKSGGKLVLKDSVSKSTYALDDQDKPGQYEGQNVKVTGTLDAQTNTIRIDSIAPESWYPEYGTGDGQVSRHLPGLSLNPSRTDLLHPRITSETRCVFRTQI